jgi:hypothetical protein
MKKVILVALLVPYMASGQIVENFEQGNSDRWVQSNPGRWKADGSEALSGNFSLHHVFDNPEAGTDKIGLPVKNLHPDEGTTRWTFIVRHGYDPSSSNNWAVFLMSDASPETMSTDGITNGYAIGVNITGTDDSLRLVKVKGNSVTTVLNCRINWQINVGITVSVKIIAERSAEGTWSVSVYRMNGILLNSASGSDKELFSTAWFSIIYRYSSTRDRLLWIDDVNIEGTFYEDTTAPSVVSCKDLGRNLLELILSEPPSSGSMIPECFSLNNDRTGAESIIKKSETTFIIEFPEIFKNKAENSLLITGLCDKTGNCSSGLKIPFTPVWAEAGDVVISEILADPLPEVSLPAKEYIEINNRSQFKYNLKDWKLFSGDQSFTVNEITMIPGEIIILCQSEDTSLFIRYGRVSGLKQFPLLTDGGKLICLTDSTGALIHGVEYSSGWYDDELKKEGGWSLEMIDTDFPFSGDENWKNSVSRNGGTPGKINSVADRNPDIFFTGITNVFPEDSTDILISFSEPLLTFEENAEKIKIDGKTITGLFPVDPLFRLFIVTVEEPLKPGIVYQMEISDDITDFAGNMAQKRSFTFGLAETAEAGDIMFNELLFNPLPGDPDYVELYNTSDKIIDASRLNLVSVTETGDISPAYQVSDDHRCLMPGAYYAFATERDRITGRYFSSQPENVFGSVSLPSMPDDKGNLVLFNRQLDRIDEVKYSEKMHYSLLSVFEGVALEKTSPNLNSMDAVNWHSASEFCGWGTPGAPNSVFSEVPATEDVLTLSSTKISPDNDGYEDNLIISLSLSGNSNVISATVFDETGRHVKRLANNLLAGQEATLLWDGTSDDGSQVNNGLYIILISLFDDTGKTKSWKKVCAVVGR